MKFDSLLTSILKIIAAIVLVLFASFIILLQVAIFRQRAPDVTWHWHVGADVFVTFCFYAAYLLIRRPAKSVGEVYCQRCHTLGGHVDISPYRSSVSGVAWHFGGFLFSIFYSASRKHKFRCGSCGEEFESHTPTSRAYRLLFLLMLAFVVNFFWSQIAQFWSD
jgi:hypothetical protein